MKCLACSFENPAIAKFCGNCAGALGRACPACGFANPATFRFCGGCAAPLAAHPDTARHPAHDDAAMGPAAGRRQLTAMFCDLADSTRLSREIDAEDLHALILIYQKICVTAVESAGGYIAQYLGDGLLAYFGYPEAFEDNAARAVRAGLALLEEIAAYNGRARAEERHAINVRVGVHTGPVVIDEIGAGARREQLALGETLNVAARLQGVAPRNSIVIGMATLRLLEDRFSVMSLGTHVLKGVDDAFEVFRVESERALLEPGEPAARRPMVGRSDELALILDRWRSAREGEGQLVVISGEAGIGKSRLVSALREAVAAQDHRWMEWRFSAHTQQSSLYPLVGVLEEQLRFERGESMQSRAAKLAESLRVSRLMVPEAPAILSALLGLPLPVGMSLPNLSIEAQRRKMLEILLAYVIGLTERVPLIVVIEDVHWIDPSSHELLGLLVEQTPALRLLLVVTARPDFQIPWPVRSHVAPIALSRLHRRDVIELAASVAGPADLPPALLREVADRTDGVPLFVEETIRALVESGAAAAGPSAASSRVLQQVPATLQDLLMSRLDRLGRGKEVAQIGAAIGREFSHDLLAAVCDIDDAVLLEALEALLKSEMVHRRGQGSDSVYVFRHALVHDMAYQSMLKKRRAEVHSRIAEVLSAAASELPDNNPELVARHWTEAGRLSEAADAWQLAGQRAMQRSEIREAIGHIENAADALKRLASSSTHSEQEIAILTQLGWGYLITRGFPAPELERVYVRASELSVGSDSPLTGAALVGLWAYHFKSANFDRGITVAAELCRYAETKGSRTYRQWGLLASGITFFVGGRTRESRESLEHANDLYRPERDNPRALGLPLDPRTVAWSAQSLSLWSRGRPETACAVSRDAVSHARSVGHAFSVGWALAHAAFCHLLAGESGTSRELATELIGFAREQSFPVFSGFAHVFRGGALADQGENARAIIEMRHGSKLTRDHGGPIYQAYMMARIAAAHLAAGQLDDAETALAEAFSLSRSGEAFYLAELYRLRGELLERRAEDGSDGFRATPPEAAGVKTAETCFHRAAEIAREQETLALELRAATSMARLLRNSGHRDEARNWIEPVYGRFVEGHETPDLREARGLIEELV